MDRKPDNDFDKWAKAMGYNGKQLGQAAQSIGYARSTATALSGDDIPEVVRLAMAARRAGLPPWTPGEDSFCATLLPISSYLREKAVVVVDAAEFDELDANPPQPTASIVNGAKMLDSLPKRAQST